MGFFYDMSNSELKLCETRLITEFLIILSKGILVFEMLLVFLIVLGF